jgi:hypothetical protein
MARPKTKTKTKAKAKAKTAPAATRKPAKATAAKSPAATSSSAHPPETRRTRAPTISVAETRRTRAPTISVRTETPRTRAPTAAPRTRAPETSRTPPTRAPRADRDTISDPPFVIAPHEVPATSSRDYGAELADPARTAELAELGDRVETVNDPDLLVSLAIQIDKLGMQLAYEISRHAHDEAHIAPLKPVLLRVPALYGKTLLRAAEKFDDQGSPRRAAFVLFEALRKAFDHDVITAVAGALSFVLEAHGQSAPATRIRTLLTERDTQRASGVDRREVRVRFSAALDELREGVAWDALEDAPELFD